MSIRVEDLGELSYGGLVTAAKWWDGQRMAQGTLGGKDIMKRTSTYAYLGPGLVATGLSAFGGLRRQERWWEHMSHGFIYAFPQFIADTMGSMQGSGSGAAVNEAQRILSAANQLSAGSRGKTARSYEHEFDSVGVI